MIKNNLKINAAVNEKYIGAILLTPELVLNVLGWLEIVTVATLRQPGLPRHLTRRALNIVKTLVDNFGIDGGAGRLGNAKSLSATTLY